ncbi:hypothetical protein BSL82_15855 [Tardibacter chloracetimidivorans]|uniref:AAA family ATPase n=1 Tax=Tardibacter chloracetimidivorans TaxID=1921510 RepID=A0A1L3ZY91_9SPHN|nr:ATP-binding protein [Tardibacter chloracetimidivorans]API60580.1 hypothetical protein BSL82_15855 [Tardibacter chloracetimidivorans]
MALHIISADERLATRQKVNIAIFGPSGSGKTFQANTLDPDKTLFLDLEAGTLAIQAWRGDVINVREEAAKMGVHPWEFARAIICLLGGPDPSAAPDSPYGAQAHASYATSLGDPATFDKYDTVFIDSITVASRMAFLWSQRQPGAFSEKTGKPDTRGAYGVLGQEMVQWLTQAQHIRSKNIITVGILDVGKDDFGRPTYDPQIEGSKAGRELPGIFDQVITLGLFDMSGGQPSFDLAKGTERGFICHQNNGYGVPAKDRSGRLDAVEAPNLGAIIKKIQSAPRQDIPVFTAPAAQTAAVDEAA